MPTQSTLGLVHRKCSFIEPGVVNYSDVGMVLVRKEVLDNMAPTMRGKPVIDKEHREVNNDDYDTGNFDGVVDSGEGAVWFDPSDANFHCSFGVKAKVLDSINNGAKVSCAYKVKRWGPGGIHNNVPYEREVLEGEYTHLAIVKNPRYEGVRIYNAKGAEKMKLMFWRKDEQGKELENSIEIESSKSTIVLENGKEHSWDEGIAAIVALEKEKEEQLKNSTQPKDSDMVDIGGGQKRSIGDIKKALQLRNDKTTKDDKKSEDEEKERDRKNAEEKEKKGKMRKDHDEGMHKSKKDLDNCEMCNAEEERTNAGHFERVKELSNSRKGDLMNEIVEPFDGFAEGRKRFGSDTATADKK